MDNTKDDKYYLRKIIENIDFILLHTSEMDLQKAEEAQSLSDAFKEKTHSLPWHELSGIRNRIVHAYDIVRVDIVYDTIKNDLKPFRDSLAKYL